MAAALLCAQAIVPADVVTDWNTIMVATVSAQPPFPQARFAAITQLAVFEAVNAITREYNPYLGTITAPEGASAEAAAVAAAYAVLKNYFPDSAASLDAARASSLASIPDGPSRAVGLGVGDAAAAAMIAARASDGAATPEFYMPGSSDPGQWQLTPSCSAGGGASLHWRNVKTFGIRSADQFRLDPPPALADTGYARDYNEVREAGGAASTERPKDRADVAQYYAVVPPPALWNPVARQIAAAQGRSLSANAHDLALLNMAMSDAAVATFDTKYHYNTWRPETAIRMGDSDGNSKTNPDGSFRPFVPTPCFPGYPSAHATLSNAAREVLERIYGAGPHAITLSTSSLPEVTLRYSTVRQITRDVDDARVFGGIHFRFDQEAGAEQGRRIGEYVHGHNLRRTGASCLED